MRALVQCAVNDKRTRILLDTGANVSVITDTFAKKLRLRDAPDHGRRIDIQGISEGKVATTRRAQVKITLDWEMVYEFEMWVMAHSAGVDVVLGTDFMIPAGILVGPVSWNCTTTERDQDSAGQDEGHARQ
ncbi:hypothetical protein PI124_g23120 [Phytophthora idaei]|nr:hypothetical protein PI124_g23120 [Phytophthora idaei]